MVLPGNLLAFSFYGKLCNIVVMRVKGTDGTELTAPATSSETQEPDLEKSDLEASALDLSLQLSGLDLDDNPEAASVSTPSRRMDPASPVPPSSAVASGGHGPAEGALTGSPGVGADLPHGSQPAGTGGREGLLPPGKAGAASSTDSFYYISSRTRIQFVETRTGVADDGDCESRVTYDMIGGLSSQLKTIRETVELPMKQAELFKSYGMMPTSWVPSFDPFFFFNMTSFLTKLLFQKYALDFM